MGRSERWGLLVAAMLLPSCHSPSLRERIEARLGAQLPDRNLLLATTTIGSHINAPAE